jgi:hypothetical protein
MQIPSFKKIMTVACVGLLLVVSTLQAQEPELRISRTQNSERTYKRNTQTLDLSRDAAFGRLHSEDKTSVVAPKAEMSPERSSRLSVERSFSIEKTRIAAVVPQDLSITNLGTGDGDIDEIEPNDRVAQGVALPVNLFGNISFNGDVDYFAFQALAGQPLAIEAFAARLSRSNLVPDIALFNAAGQQLARSVGSVNEDPLLRYTPVQDEILIVGIADVDDFGGARFNYMLNLTRGVDADESEPNDRAAQALNPLPLTIFGEISTRNDVDFYSFTATAGQTLIVDVDAEVLGSRLDAEVNLSDPTNGVEYFYNDQEDGNDPRFNIVLPYTGQYVIGIGAVDSSSSGFYRLNLSLVPQTGAPVITSVRRLSKKLLEITGTGFSDVAFVEVNSEKRRTTTIASGVLQAKVKNRVGQIVTVVNPPADRRSNPLIVQ